MCNKVGIVIVNYNTYDILINCIDSIFSHVKCEYEIFIVDNNSNIDIKTKIVEKYQHNKLINLIMLSENLGYSGGNNLGCREALKHCCDSILVVNSDIEFKNDVASIMRKDLSGQVAVVGPKVINLDGENGQHIIGTYNFKEALFDRYPFHIIKKIIHRKNMLNYEDRRVFQGMVSGCCFMIDAELFSKLGFFDDNVFLYSEERILSIKLKEVQKKVCYEPIAFVLHKEGKTTQKKGTAFSDYHRYASDYYTIIRYVKVNFFKAKFFKYIRLFVFWLKCIKDSSYWNEFKRLKQTMKKIDNGDYKINV